MWADRILHSATTDQLTQTGLATMAELRAISQAWLAWSGHPDAWLLLPHGEILVTVPEVQTRTLAGHSAASPTREELPELGVKAHHG